MAYVLATDELEEEALNFKFDIDFDKQLETELKEAIANIFSTIFPNPGDENKVLEEVGI
jgi:hypothetical protein